MDRKTAYRGEVPYETDFLYAQRFAYEGLGLLALDLLGSSTLVTGLACTPSAPAALTVQVAPGRIYSLQNLEPTVWGQYLSAGGLAGDVNADHNILKQGLLRDTSTLSGFVAPGTGGQSINYLVQASFSEVDSTPATRTFYNTSQPASPLSADVSDYRQDKLVLTIKAGAAAATGSQTTPAPDAGCVPLWVVTVANGQTTITSGNITQHGSAPILTGVALQPLRLGSLITPPQITADQNDYAPAGIAGASRISITTDASRNITGFAAPTYDGALKVLRNGGSFDAVLKNQSVSSAAANRFNFGQDRTLAPSRSILLIYDLANTCWRDVNSYTKASASDVNGQTNDEKFVTPAGLVAAQAAQALTDAATVAWNMANGPRAKVTLGANRTLGQPTNLYDGLSGSLQVIQDGSGSRLLAYAACWDFGALGTPTLSTGAGKRDMIFYEVVDAVTPVIRASFSKAA